MPMPAAFGVMDLYGNLEEFVFDIFRVYIEAHPEHLLKGDDFKELRRLRREAEQDETKKVEWESAWASRREQWQRNKLYDGLGKVFRSFCASAGVKAPSSHKNVSAEHWAETIDIIGLVRNCLTHNVVTVNPELATPARSPTR